MFIHFDGRDYCSSQQKKLEDDIKNVIPDTSKMYVKKCVSGIYDNKIRHSSKSCRPRFDGHYSAGISGKKSLAIFYKIHEDVINIVVLGHHKFSKDNNKNKNKKNRSSVYYCFWRDKKDKDKYGKYIQLN